MSYLFLIMGLAITVLGSTLLVDGASSFAKKLKVSDLIIGLTIVAFGTSTPELTVSLYSALNGSTDIAIGNVVGSNIFNVFFILGVAAMIYPIKVQSRTVRIEIPLTFLAAVATLILVNDAYLDGHASLISRGDGLILLCFFCIFMYYTFFTAKGDIAEPESQIKLMPTWKSVVYIVLGLVGLYFGGKFMVDGATVIATAWGMSEAVIGLTIVAAGTSVPELATSAVAAYKKNSDIAIGNVVGSNIFNTFFIMGSSAAVCPLPFSPSGNVDALVNVLASVLLFLFALVGRGKSISRLEGGLLFAIYIAYVSYLIVQVG